MSREIQQIDATAADLRRYRIELPNLLDDSKLHPFAFRLLAHYYRRRVCWESIETTADLCCMSVGSVTKYRSQLARDGWIHVERVKNERGGIDGIRVTVVDVWAKNFERYGSAKSQQMNLQVTTDELASRNRRNKERKEKKEPSKKGLDALAFDFDSLADAFPSNLDSDEFKAAARRWVAHVASMPKQTVTESRIVAWLNRCSRFGADVSIQVIDFAISGGKHDLYSDAFERFVSTERGAARSAERQTTDHSAFEQLLAVYDGSLSADSLSDEIVSAIEATGCNLEQALEYPRDWFVGQFRADFVGEYES